MKAKEEIKKNDDKKFNKAVQEAMLEEAHKKKILNSYEKTANQLGEMQAARTQIKELEKENQTNQHRSWPNRTRYFLIVAREHLFLALTKLYIHHKFLKNDTKCE